MQKIALLLFVTILCFGTASNQTHADSSRALRSLFPQNIDPEDRSKLEDVLRVQDLRTPFEGKLLAYLADANPVVRERATLACGSLQDTVYMTALMFNLTEVQDLAVQEAAAFAIGQTASQLSEAGKNSLEHELLWARFDKTSAQNRLIEEIGKFGSEQALRDILLRLGTDSRYSPALTMSIARFAIRGIVTDEAVHHLLQYLKPIETTPWEVVYALQRIGNHQQIRDNIEAIVQLYKHPNPLARMHVAALLGKVKDEQHSLEPLQRLADHDGDWRVRVNAFRALGNFSLQGKDEIIELFRRAFRNDNRHVAITALAAIGTTSLKEEEANEKNRRLFDELRKIAQNKDRDFLWQVQAEAALSLAKLTGAAALTFIQPSGNLNPRLEERLIVAAGTTGAPEAVDVLSPYLASDDPKVQRSALEGLQEIAKKNSSSKVTVETAYAAAINALKSRDVAVITTAASMLGDTLFQRKTSVKPLIDVLGELSGPDDVEAIQEIAATLGKLGDPKAIDILQQKFRSSDHAIALAAANALNALTGQDYASQVEQRIEPAYVDLNFAYLQSLPETTVVTIETIRGDIRMELYKAVAPFTVMSFLKLVDRGFYRGLPFHRVVPNFVIQGGDPRGDGWGGPGYAIRSEFSPLTYETGMVGVASAGKDTEGSQFFIVQSPQPHLDGRYTIFGKVTAGMNVVNEILVDDHISNIKRGN